jgi:hypothetical protein
MMRQVKAALHNHLRTSSFITPAYSNKSIRNAEQRLGKGGIFGVINFDPSATEVDPRWHLFVDGLRFDNVLTGNGVYIPEKDILAVRGQEVHTAEGVHILLIGTTLDQRVPNGSTIEQTLDLADEFGAIKVADHPYHKHGIGKILEECKELRERFDGYEAHNAIAVDFGSYKDANEKARLFFEEVRSRDSPWFHLISDDGHSIFELGKSWQTITMPENYGQFRDSPAALNAVLREGLVNGTKIFLPYYSTETKLGFSYHAVSLAILIGARKLGLDPNRQTAPLLDKIGIKI